MEHFKKYKFEICIYLCKISILAAYHPVAYLCKLAFWLHICAKFDSGCIFVKIILSGLHICANFLSYLKPRVSICHRLSNYNRKNIPLISFNTLHNYIFSSRKKIYAFKWYITMKTISHLRIYMLHFKAIIWVLYVIFVFIVLVACGKTKQPDDK